MSKDHSEDRERLINAFFPNTPPTGERTFPMLGAEKSLAEVAAELGLHPDEVHPRAETWLHERLNWEADLAQEREHSQELRTGCVELLTRACALKDGLFGWYWDCRHCGKSSPAVSYKPNALVSDIPHRPDCVVPRMQAIAVVRVIPV